MPNPVVSPKNDESLTLHVLPNVIRDTSDWESSASLHSADGTACCGVVRADSVFLCELSILQAREANGNRRTPAFLHAKRHQRKHTQPSRFGTTYVPNVDSLDRCPWAHMVHAPTRIRSKLTCGLLLPEPASTGLGVGTWSRSEDRDGLEIDAMLEPSCKLSCRLAYGSPFMTYYGHYSVGVRTCSS